MPKFQSGQGSQPQKGRQEGQGDKSVFSNGNITIVNLDSGVSSEVSTIDGEIMPFKNPEGLCLVGNRVLVATWDSACSAIYPIDTSTDALGTPIAVAGKAPQELLLDGEGMLWVMGGNQAQNVEATLSRIDPATGSILKSYSFGKEDPIHPIFNKTKDTILVSFVLFFI